MQSGYAAGSMDTDAEVPPALPYDVLAAILGRLLARNLAASRCVCKAWRDLVDDRGLLQRIRHLLPHSVSGIFINYVDHEMPHFFACPTSAAAAAVPQIDGKFSYVVPERPHGDCMVTDHCNGLVLYRDESYGDLYVCNPTTRRWVRLPQLAGVREAASLRRAFLVFSPAVSRHFQVLLAPLELVPEEDQRQNDPRLQEAHPAGDAEWPPARWTWHVFSSRTGRWRKRVFVREGEVAGMVADLRMDSLRYSPQARWRYAIHQHGALYVHCRGEYVSRLSSLLTGDCSYRVIKSPIDRSECYKEVKSYLGGSEGEVYFVAINTWRLRVWMLNDHKSERHDPMAGSEWILKHDRVLRPDNWWGVVAYGDCYQQIQRDGPWILDDYYKYRKHWSKLDWSSDGEDDVICSNADGEEEIDDEEHYLYPGTFNFVGFHPYKEVIFMETLNVVVAYHLSTSKVQFLGILKPDEWNSGLYDSFVYTPCHDLRYRG